MGLAAEAAIRCVSCGRSFGPAEWRALTSVRTLTGDEVAVHVVGWSAQDSVEVRACACGRPMARRGTRPSCETAGER
jgi:DNA-directed RNA polymerase subunit N (RpoN/RPB10)